MTLNQEFYKKLDEILSIIDGWFCDDDGDDSKFKNDEINAKVEQLHEYDRLLYELYLPEKYFDHYVLTLPRKEFYSEEYKYVIEKNYLNSFRHMIDLHFPLEVSYEEYEDEFKVVRNLAVSLDNVEAFKCLLEPVPDIYMRGTFMSDINQAELSKSVKCYKFIMDKEKFGRGCYAKSHKGSIEIIKLLEEKFQADRNLFTLSWCIKSGSLECVEMALKNGHELTQTHKLQILDCGSFELLDYFIQKHGEDIILKKDFKLLPINNKVDYKVIEYFIIKMEIDINDYKNLTFMMKAGDTEFLKQYSNLYDYVSKVRVGIMLNDDVSRLQAILGLKCKYCSFKGSSYKHIPTCIFAKRMLELVYNLGHYECVKYMTEVLHFDLSPMLSDFNKHATITLPLLVYLKDKGENIGKTSMINAVLSNGNIDAVTYMIKNEYITDETFGDINIFNVNPKNSLIVIKSGIKLKPSEKVFEFSVVDKRWMFSEIISHVPANLVECLVDRCTEIRADENKRFTGMSCKLLQLLIEIHKWRIPVSNTALLKIFEHPDFFDNMIKLPHYLFNTMKIKPGMDVILAIPNPQRKKVIKLYYNTSSEKPPFEIVKEYKS